MYKGSHISKVSISLKYKLCPNSDDEDNQGIKAARAAKKLFEITPEIILDLLHFKHKFLSKEKSCCKWEKGKVVSFILKKSFVGFSATEVKRGKKYPQSEVHRQLLHISPAIGAWQQNVHISRF